MNKSAQNSRSALSTAALAQRASIRELKMANTSHSERVAPVCATVVTVVIHLFCESSQFDGLQ
jgi:hypothetical protein